MSHETLLQELEDRLIWHIRSFQSGMNEIDNPYLFNAREIPKSPEAAKARISELVTAIGIVKQHLGDIPKKVQYSMDGPVEPGFD